MKNKNLVKTIIMSLLVSMLMSISVFANSTTRIDIDYYLTKEDESDIETYKTKNNSNKCKWGEGAEGDILYYREDTEDEWETLGEGFAKVIENNGTHIYYFQNGESYKQVYYDATVDVEEKLGDDYEGDIEEFFIRITKDDYSYIGYKEVEKLITNKVNELSKNKKKDGGGGGGGGEPILHLEILIENTDGAWVDGGDIGKTAGKWYFVNDDESVLADGYALIQEEGGTYNISKFNKDGVWEGYKFSNVSTSESNAHKTLEELEQYDNQVKNSQAGWLDNEGGFKPREPEPAGGGGGAGGGGAGGGGGGGDDDRFDRGTIPIEKVDSIETGIPLDIDLNEEGRMQLYGMCFVDGIMDDETIGSWLTAERIEIFNKWLEIAKYSFRVDIDAISKLMKGKGFSWIKDDVVVIDKKVLKVMQENINARDKKDKTSLYNTICMIFMIIVWIYAFLLVVAWFLEMHIASDNSKYKPFNMMTAGFKEACEDASEIEKYVDNNGVERNITKSWQRARYVDLKKLIVFVIIIFILGAFIGIAPLRNFIGALIGWIIDLIKKIGDMINKR